MISTLSLPIDFNKSMVGYVVEKTDPAPNAGESIKVYIPLLMSSIIKTIPTETHNTVNSCSRNFLNDETCRPASKNLIKGQNYITAVLENNAAWENVSDYIDSDKESSNLSIISDGLNINATIIEHYKKYKTVGNEKVECIPVNGKISKMLFNTNKYIK